MDCNSKGLKALLTGGLSALEGVIAVLTHDHFKDAPERFVAGDRIYVTLDAGAVTGNTEVALNLVHGEHDSDDLQGFILGDASELTDALNGIKVNKNAVNWDANEEIKIYAEDEDDHVATLTVTTVTVDDREKLSVTKFTLVNEGDALDEGDYFVRIPAIIDEQKVEILVIFDVTSVKIEDTGRVFTLDDPSHFGATLKLDTTGDNWTMGNLSVNKLFDGPEARPEFTATRDTRTFTITPSSLNEGMWNRSGGDVRVYDTSLDPFIDTTNRPTQLPPAPGVYVGSISISGRTATFKPAGDVQIGALEAMNNLVAVVEHSHFSARPAVTSSEGRGNRFGRKDIILVPISIEDSNESGFSISGTQITLDLTENELGRASNLNSAESLVNALNMVSVNNVPIEWVGTQTRTINLYADESKTPNAHVATLTFDVDDGRVTGTPEFILTDFDDTFTLESSSVIFAEIPAGFVNHSEAIALTFVVSALIRDIVLAPVVIPPLSPIELEEDDADKESVTDGELVADDEKATDDEIAVGDETSTDDELVADDESAAGDETVTSDESAIDDETATSDESAIDDETVSSGE